jgi:hypothetical protein
MAARGEAGAKLGIQQELQRGTANRGNTPMPRMWRNVNIPARRVQTAKRMFID